MKKLIMAVFGFMNHLFGYRSADFQTVGCDAFESGMQQDGVQLVDVRTPSEYADGTLERAINIDYLQEDFASRASDLLDPSRPVYIFCRSGHRSANAAKILAKLGYTLVNLDGGYNAWTAEAKPMVRP